MQNTENASLREISAKRVSALSQGTETFPVKTQSSKITELLNPEEAAVKTLDHALASETPQKSVQELPSQILYFALKKATPESLVQALHHCSPEQWQRLVDYDCWGEDRVRLPALASWLLVYRAMDGEGKQFLDRFRQLGEELQVASVCGQFELINEDEYDKLEDSERDSFVPLPGHAGFYRTSTSDEKMQEFYDALINASFQNDMHFAFSIIGHGAYSPPQESEYQALRFRKARIEEDGFVDKEDALAFWRPSAQVRSEVASYVKSMACNTSQISDSNALVSSECLDNSFLDTCIGLLADNEENSGRLQQKLLLFANSIASAVGFEVYELGRSNRSLELAKGALSLGLEKLSVGNPDAGAQILNERSWQVIFQNGIAVTDFFRIQTIGLLREVFGGDVDALQSFYESRSFGKALFWIDQQLGASLEPTYCDMLKGLFNRFPLAGGSAAGPSQQSDDVGFIVISDMQTLQQLFAEIKCVLSLIQFLRSLSSIELTHAAEALRSSLILSTRTDDHKSYDWGLTVRTHDLSRWSASSSDEKAAAVCGFISRLQIRFSDLDPLLLANVIGDMVGGKQFSMMKSGDMFYAFG